MQTHSFMALEPEVLNRGVLGVTFPLEALPAAGGSECPGLWPHPSGHLCYHVASPVGLFPISLSAFSAKDTVSAPRAPLSPEILDLTCKDASSK